MSENDPQVTTADGRTGVYSPFSQRIPITSHLILISVWAVLAPLVSLSLRADEYKLPYHLTFDGQNDSVRVSGSQDDFQHILEGLGTISLWVKPSVLLDSGTRSDRQFAISTGGRIRGTDRDVNLGLNGGGEWWVRISDGNGRLFAVTTDTPKPEAGVWYHIAVICGGEDRGFYINGEKRASWDEYSGARGNWRKDFHFGFSPDKDRNWHGSMRAVRIYRRNLTASEVRKLESGAAPDTEENERSGYWPMNEGQGPKVHDRSGNHRYGMLWNGGRVLGGARWRITETRLLEQSPGQVVPALKESVRQHSNSSIRAQAAALIGKISRTQTYRVNEVTRFLTSIFKESEEVSSVRLEALQAVKAQPESPEDIIARDTDAVKSLQNMARPDADVSVSLQFAAVKTLKQLNVEVPSAGAEPDEDLIDGINFGVPKSEQAHSFEASDSIAVQRDLHPPFRRIMGKSTLKFELADVPDRITYITIQFWGSDQSRNPLQIKVGKEQQSLTKFEDYMIVSGPPEPPLYGRFYYMTFKLPEQPDQARPDRIRIQLSGTSSGDSSSGIYRAYTHLTPMFRPPSNDPKGTRPKQMGHWPDTEVSFEREKERLNQELNGEIDQYLNWEAEQWEDYLRGVKGQATDLRIINTIARAVLTPWSDYYQDTEAMRSVVLALDVASQLHGPKSTFGTVGLRPGLVYLGYAVLNIHEFLKGENLLEQAVADRDGSDGAHPTRRDVYTGLLEGVRAWYVHDSGMISVPNQQMYNLATAVAANAALRKLAPEQAWALDEKWTDDKLPDGFGVHPHFKHRGYEHVNSFKKMLDVVGGIRYEPFFSGDIWEFSPSGMPNENRYSTLYGVHCLGQIVELWQLSGYEPLQEVARKAHRAFSYFQYPSIDTGGYRTWRLMSTFSVREGRRYPGYGGRFMFPGAPVLAAETGFPLSIRQMQLHQRYYNGRITREGSNVGLGAFNGPKTWKAIQNRSTTDYRLPMERNGVSGWTDEYLGLVAVNHRGRRLYVDLTYLSGPKYHSRDLLENDPFQPAFDIPYRAEVNTQRYGSRMARVHFTTDRIDRIADVHMRIPFGYRRLYEVNYGNYHVRMNMSHSHTYPTRIEGDQEGVDLVSGKKLDLTNKLTIPPKTTVIVYTSDEGD